jgi:diaminopimelate decarboxylase
LKGHFPQRLPRPKIVRQLKTVTFGTGTKDELLVIADAGAYGFAMRSDYNLQEPPGEIFI